MKGTNYRGGYVCTERQEAEIFQHVSSVGLTSHTGPGAVLAMAFPCLPGASLLTPLTTNTINIHVQCRVGLLLSEFLQLEHPHQ